MRPITVFVFPITIGRLGGPPTQSISLRIRRCARTHSGSENSLISTNFQETGRIPSHHLVVSLNSCCERLALPQVGLRGAGKRIRGVEWQQGASEKRHKNSRHARTVGMLSSRAMSHRNAWCTSWLIESPTNTIVRSCRKSRRISLARFAPSGTTAASLHVGQSSSSGHLHRRASGGCEPPTRAQPRFVRSERARDRRAVGRALD